MQPHQEALDDPLEPSEIAAGEDRQPRRLIRQTGALFREVDVGDLEELGVELPVGFVVQPNRQEAGHKALAQGTLPPAAGMVDPKRWDRGTGLERGAQAFFDQAEGHGLVESGTGQEFADDRFDTLALTAGSDRQRYGPLLRDMLVAVDPSDFLDQVDLALQVAPPARWADRQRDLILAECLQSQCFEDSRGFRPIDGDAEDSFDLPESERDRRTLRRPSTDIDHTGMERAAAHLQDQLGAATAGPFGPLRDRGAVRTGNSTG